MLSKHKLSPNCMNSNDEEEAMKVFTGSNEEEAMRHWRWLRTMYHVVLAFCPHVDSLDLSTVIGALNEMKQKRRALKCVRGKWYLHVYMLLCTDMTSLPISGHVNLFAYPLRFVSPRFCSNDNKNGNIGYIWWWLSTSVLLIAILTNCFHI